MAPKWSILVSQCEMDRQKPAILLNFGTFSLGGSWGHPMRPKLNLNDKGQISKPNEYTNNFTSYLTCIFLSVRNKLKRNILPSNTVFLKKVSNEKEMFYEDWRPMKYESNLRKITQGQCFYAFRLRGRQIFVCVFFSFDWMQ